MMKDSDILGDDDESEEAMIMRIEAEERSVPTGAWRLLTSLRHLMPDGHTLTQNQGWLSQTGSVGAVCRPG